MPELPLSHMQEMEAVGTLAGGIAHEFNNLLQVILGNSEILRLVRHRDEPGHHELKEIIGAVQRGKRLTQQLLTFCRKTEVRKQRTDLNQEVKRFKETWMRSLSDTIEVQLVLQKRLRPIIADTDYMEQILRNLTVNASDAMPNGGKLSIKTANMTLDERDCMARSGITPGDYVLLDVSDTGCGMDRRTQKHMFEPFFTTKEVGKGTGLGLAAVYGIVKVHGGYIDVESGRGKGTTFSILLPAMREHKLKRVNRKQPVVCDPDTILLVDDEEVVLEVGEKIIRKLGYDVVTAKSGKEALEAYNSSRDHIALIILDIIMPGSDGNEVYDRLKEINPKLKVMLSSGYGLNAQAREMIQRGCNGFIQKPFSVNALSRKIGEILEKK